MANNLTGYDLSRNWFDFCFENPEITDTTQTALFFFIIEHCNRLGWKDKFGLPTTMTMEALSIKSYNTYKKALEKLVEHGFVKMIEKSKNQYSANIIALSKYDKALDKALDKAFLKHASKQVQSNDSIDKQINNKQINNPLLKTDFKNFPKNPLPEHCGELPDVTAGACVQLLKFTKAVTITLERVKEIWPVFLAAKVDGVQFYASVEAVRSHFIDWIKFQKFEVDAAGKAIKNGKSYEPPKDSLPYNKKLDSSKYDDYDKNIKSPHVRA